MPTTRESSSPDSSRAPGAALRPTISVCVPTRNRPAHITACVQTILATDGFLELIVVDQSDDDGTERAIAAIQDRRLHYIRTSTRGVTSGRNIGIEESRGSIVAFTDDDCRVKADWAVRLSEAFQADETVGVVCGRVQVPVELLGTGWAESFQPRQREWRKRFPPIGQWGITANLALRKVVAERVGPFDPMLGAGAPLRSGGEPDFLFRVIRAGYKVINADEVVVDHLGIRKPGAESTRLIRGYGVGTAAAFMKHARLGDPMGAVIYLRFVGSTAARVCGNVLRRGRPVGSGFLLALLGGAFTSFKYGISRDRGVYIER